MFLHLHTFYCNFLLKFAVLCSVWVTTFEMERFDPKEQLEQSFKDIGNCHDPLDLLTSNNSLMNSVASCKAMDKLCEEIEQYLSCIDKKTKRSMTLEDQVTFKVLYNSTAVVMTELCHNQTYQQEFVKHAHCIKDVDNTDCETKHLETLQEIQKHPRDQLAWQRICCSFQKFQQCSKQTVGAACGHEAGEFYMKMLESMSTSMKQQCQPVSNVADMCQAINLASRSFGEVAWLQVLPFALIVVLSTIRL